jgi:hypothetical protein
VDALWQEAQKYVEARAAVLERMPYNELAAFPEYSEEPSPSHLPKFQVAAWRKSLENRAQRIIVQASRHYLGGIMSRTAVAGFDKHLSGEITEVPEGEFE